ncbi:MAG: LysR family transcriptional regulator [Alphaproteobacteria bacterium]|nr:LysR family transcriptional regulator [Alphaproteobacteria bacterium]
MELYQLHYALAVAETGSFTRGAARVFVSQPTLSQGIKKLEQELGVALFERGARRARPTPEGERFLEHAREALGGLNRAKHALRQSAPQNRFRVGLLSSLPSAATARLLADFGGAHGEAGIELMEGGVQEIDRWLSQGRLDAAITRLDLAAPSGERHHLFNDRLLLALPAGHALARKASLKGTDLDARSLIVRTHCETLTEARRRFDTLGIRPRIVHRTTRDDWALRLVAAGVGLCLAPNSLEAPELAWRPVEGVEIRRTIGLAWHERAPEALCRAFLGFAQSHAWRAGADGSARLGFAH